MHDIHFDATTHTYTVDGVVKPSVTQILEAAGFINASKYAPGAANFGTLLHSATEALDSGVVTLADYRDTDLYDKLSAYQLFKDQKKPIYLHREYIAYSEEYDYCGTIDIHEAVAGVIDIKAGYRNPEPWHGLQLALYDLLLGHGGLPRYNLYLGKGVYKLEPRVDKRDYPAALGAVAIWHWRNR